MSRVELAEKIYIKWGYVDGEYRDDEGRPTTGEKWAFNKADAFIAEVESQSNATGFMPFDAELTESDIAGTKGVIIDQNESGLYRFETTKDKNNHNFSYGLWVDSSQFKRIDPQPKVYFKNGVYYTVEYNHFYHKWFKGFWEGIKFVCTGRSYATKAEAQSVLDICDCAKPLDPQPSEPETQTYETQWCEECHHEYTTFCDDCRCLKPTGFQPKEQKL